MRISSRVLALALLGTVVGAVHAEPIKRIQTPAVSPDGKVIAFSWQGDLWLVGAQGGRAERLTVHAANDTRPRWFPDGSRIAFASNRFGSNDVFTIKPDGSDLKRVTFDSSSELPTGVSPDGRTIYGQTSQFGRSDVFRVSSNGGDLVRLTEHPFEAEFTALPTPDGKKVIYARGGYATTAWQKIGMTSASLPEIWVADNTVPLRNHRRLTNNERTDLPGAVTTEGDIILINNASGTPNVWRMRADGGGATQLTKHTVGSARNVSASAKGDVIAYELNSELYVLDAKSGQTRQLTVDVPDDARTNPVLDLALTSGVQGYSISPDGKRAVISVRGEIFLLPEKGGTTRRLTDNPAWDSEPVWLDNKTILYTAAVDGKREIRAVGLDGKSKTYVSDPKVDVTGPHVSPDGKNVAYIRNGEDLLVVPAGGGEARKIVSGNFSDALEGTDVVSWSPDSAWLATHVLEGRRYNVMCYQVATGKGVRVGRVVNRPQLGGPSVPMWLPNGRGLYFTSPEYGEDLELLIIDLLPLETTFTEDDLDKLDDKPDAKKPEVKVEIQEAGIELRMRRLTGSLAFNPIASADSKTITYNGSDGIASVPVAGGAPTPVAALGAYNSPTLSRDGRKLYLVAGGGRLQSWTPGTPAPTTIAFNAQFTVNRRAEEQALFQDIVWAMERLYYDPQLHGKNWPDIKARYGKLVPFTFDRADFYAMMGEMMEELDSSHLGATAPPDPIPNQGSEPTAYLGVDFDPKVLADRGAYVVGSVMPGSPAADPASELKVGDRVLSVDGVEPGGSNPMSVLLLRKTGRKVELGIERAGVKRTVTIRPLAASARDGLEYERFVAETRERVNKLSGGKIGYMHVTAMSEGPYQRFLRETRTEAEGKQAVLIDCRFNGGGSTAVKMLGILVKEPWLTRTTRGPFGVRLSENLFRSDALELPSALLVNNYSFSNAEVIAEGFRKLKIGPIIGERTPGYVIGTGGYSLWDGGFIRMPSIGAFAINGENLENNGRRPDITVWFDPNAWAEGRDLQIEKAVEEMLKRI